MIASLILVTAITTGEYRVWTHEDEFTERKAVFANVQGTEIKANKEHVTLVVFVIGQRIPATTDPTIGIAFKGLFLLPFDREVLFRIDDGKGGRFSADCEWEARTRTLSCSGTTHDLIEALKAAKYRVRVRTDLADFTIPLKDLQRALAQFERLVEENNPAGKAIYNAGVE
jgi:hypothetical protein